MIALLAQLLVAQVQFQDGPTTIIAERAPDDIPGFHALELRYPRTGKHTRAYINRHLIVRPVDGKSPRWERSGLRPLRALMPSIDLWLVESVDGKDALDTVERLTREDAGKHFSVVTPDFFLRRTMHTINIPPSDSRYGGQWYLDRIDIESAWAINTGSPSTSVVVVDNGCDAQQPDLVDKLDPGLDVASEDDDPTYEPHVNGNNHGTSCASLVAARTDNGLGIAGACPECRLRCVRLLSSDPQGVAISADVNAFNFALEQGAAVVSNSWGFTDAIPVPRALQLAIENVFDNGRGGKGAMVLFAAGNENRVVGDEELLAVRGVIGVGAITLYEDATSFTNKGASVDIVAPTGTLAADITGADGDDPGDFTSRFGGTSSACPVAAGVAALLVTAAPEKTAAELSEILIHTTHQSPYATPDSSGHDDVFGFGVLSPAHALRSALNLPEPTDGGTVDVDAGSSASQGSGGDAPPPRRAASCVCLSATPDAPLALVLIALAFLRRRRVGVDGALKRNLTVAAREFHSPSSPACLHRAGCVGHRERRQPSLRVWVDAW